MYGGEKFCDWQFESTHGKSNARGHLLIHQPPPDAWATDFTIGCKQTGNQYLNSPSNGREQQQKQI